MKTLYLCEKPSQARDIARALRVSQKHEGYLSSDNLVVSWCFGHLLELAEPESYCPNLKPWRREVLPIIPTHWKMVIRKECQKQFNILKKLLETTESIVIATDADREGEVIAREILEYCHYQGEVQRLWLQALDEASIQKALKGMREGVTTELLYLAGLARQRADWLVGMNLTMAATSQYSNGQGVLSVGRVQTPTLRLIVERNNTIQNFTPVTHYELVSQFTTEENNTFHAKWHPKEEHLDDEQHCLSKEVVEDIIHKIKGQKGHVAKFKENDKSTTPPIGLSLSQLQKIASSHFNFSVKETLDIAQSLYEKHKATTYPRTDCGYLPTSQFIEANLILTLLGSINPDLKPWVAQCDLTYQSPIWNDAKITAHHAIIPLFNPNIAIKEITEKERQLYQLISEYYIAQFLGDYHYRQQTLTVTVLAEEFKATTHLPIKAGWKALLKPQNDEVLQAEVLPVLSKNQNVFVSNSEILTKQTTPPAQYTEGTLIEAMKSIGKKVDDPILQKFLKESSGIGTEATRANIIETLFKRGFVTKKGKQLIATEKGIHLITTLPTKVSDPILTAQLEQALEEIAHGKTSLPEFMATQTKVLHDMLNALDSKQSAVFPTDNYQCPYCHKTLIKRYSPKNKSHFWGCAGYPLCKTTYPDKAGKPNFEPRQKRQAAANN